MESRIGLLATELEQRHLELRSVQDTMSANEREYMKSLSEQSQKRHTEIMALRRQIEEEAREEVSCAFLYEVKKFQELLLRPIKFKSVVLKQQGKFRSYLEGSRKKIYSVLTA